MIQLYHNNRCSKSRATKQILEERKVDFVEINYLQNPPTLQELQNILHALQVTPSEFIRSGEKVFKELNLHSACEEEMLEVMVQHPILIERPIVVSDKGVRIGRPPENVLEIL
jgi:arsenate reductase